MRSESIGIGLSLAHGLKSSRCRRWCVQSRSGDGQSDSVAQRAGESSRPRRNSFICRHTPGFSSPCQEPDSMSLFASVELAPRDPILGLNEAFNADPNPAKVNLGVGVYTDDDGRIPLLKAVRAAEQARVEAGLPRGYLPMEGIAAYDASVQKLLFGEAS